MHTWPGWTIGVLVALLCAALGLLLGRWLWRRQRQESGWQDWTKRAKALSWRDRRRLYWATLTGRAVTDPALAALAARRSTAAADLVEGVNRRMKWYWVAGGLLFVAVGVLNMIDHSWFWGGYNIVVGVFIAFMYRWNRWDLRRTRRGAEANRRIAERGAAGPTPDAPSTTSSDD
jgi:Flp pilus assembly protein TadB